MIRPIAWTRTTSVASAMSAGRIGSAAFVAAAVLAVASLPLPARADAVVRGCQQDVQAVPPGVDNVATALARGGVVRFECPRGTTIRMTRGHRITTPTRIEGGGVVLDGAGLVATLLDVDAAHNLVLVDIEIRRTRQLPQSGLSAGPRPSVIDSHGRIELERVTIVDGEDPIRTRGEVAVDGAVFEGNRGTAIRTSQATVRRSRFERNESAIRLLSGELVDNTFVRQSNAAVLVSSADAGLVSIRGNRFTDGSGLSAVRISTRGSHRVELRRNRFERNDGGLQGGAVHAYDPAVEAEARGQPPAIVAALRRLPAATIHSSHNRFEGNSGQSSGALTAQLPEQGILTSTGDLFLRNASRYGGGAIGFSGGLLQVGHALLADNTAVARGGAIWAVGPGRVVISNAVIVRNRGLDAAVVASDAVMRLQHVTIAANDAVGVAVTGAAADAARIEHSILSANRGGDCVGVPAAAFDGANLQSPQATCAAGTPVDPLLDAMFVPLPGSPAYGAGEAQRCRRQPVDGKDLLFRARGNQSCTLGAYESPPTQHVDRRRLGELGHAALEDHPAMPAEPFVPAADTADDGSLRSRLEAALTADAASPTLSMATRVEVGDTVDVFIVEHVRPAGWRLVRNPKRRPVTYVSVGDRAWQRIGVGDWRASAPVSAQNPLPFAIPSLTDRITGFGTVASDPMTIVGHTRWVNGATTTEGRIAIRLQPDGLLSQLRFEGRCGGQRCRIFQVIERPQQLRIDPPA